MGEIVYIDDMAGKKTERLQIVLSPEDLEHLDEWRRNQPDIPNRSESVRRLIGFKAGTADWEDMQAEAEKIDPAEMDPDRKHLLIGKAIAKGIVAMSESHHPAYSDMTELYSILTKEFPTEARLSVMPAILRDLHNKI